MSFVMAYILHVCTYVCAVLISSASFSIVWADPCQIHAYSGGWNCRYCCLLFRILEITTAEKDANVEVCTERCTSYICINFLEICTFCTLLLHTLQDRYVHSPFTGISPYLSTGLKISQFCTSRPITVSLELCRQRCAHVG